MPRREENASPGPLLPAGLPSVPLAWLTWRGQQNLLLIQGRNEPTWAAFCCWVGNKGCLTSALGEALRHLPLCCPSSLLCTPSRILPRLTLASPPGFVVGLRGEGQGGRCPRCLVRTPMLSIRLLLPFRTRFPLLLLESFEREPANTSSPHSRAQVCGALQHLTKAKTLGGRIHVTGMGSCHSIHTKTQVNVPTPGD